MVPNLWGGRQDAVDEPVKGFSKNLFFVGNLGDGFVEAAPGEVVDKAGLSALLRDGCKGVYPDSREVVDLL